MHAYVLTDGVPLALYEIPATDGVAVFFVLSGFLIGRILIKTFEAPHITPRILLEFWIRRWCRTLPAYYLVLTGLAIYGVGQGHAQTTQVWQYFLFSQNLFSIHPGFFPEAWSLSIEEWFYVLLPLALYAVIKFLSWPSRKAFIWVILLVIFLVTALRIWKVGYFGYQTIEDWDNHLRKQVITRMDSLMYGVLGAYLSNYYANIWDRLGKPALIAGLTVMLAAKLIYWSTESIWFLNYVWLSAMPLATLLTLPFLSRFQAEPNVVVKCITFVSLISYAMYLLNHTVVLDMLLPGLRSLNRWGNDVTGIATEVLDYLSYWSVTIALSWLLFRFFETKLTACREPMARWLSKTI